jgi:hypothetical protein
MGAIRHISRKRESLRIGGKEKFLAVDEDAPIGSKHPIRAGLENQREILVEADK